MVPYGNRSSEKGGWVPGVTYRTRSGGQGSRWFTLENTGCRWQLTPRQSTCMHSWPYFGLLMLLVPSCWDKDHDTCDEHYDRSVMRIMTGDTDRDTCDEHYDRSVMRIMTGDTDRDTCDEHYDRSVMRIMTGDTDHDTCDDCDKNNDM